MRSTLIILIIILPFVFMGQIQAQAVPEGNPAGYFIDIGCGLDYNTLSVLGDVRVGGGYNISDGMRLMVAFGGYSGAYNIGTKEFGIEQNLNLQTMLRQKVWKGLSFQAAAGGERIDQLQDDATPVTYATSGASALWTWKVGSDIEISAIFGSLYNFGQNQTKFSLAVEIAKF